MFSDAHKKGFRHAHNAKCRGITSTGVAGQEFVALRGATATFFAYDRNMTHLQSLAFLRAGRYVEQNIYPLETEMYAPISYQFLLPLLFREEKLRMKFEGKRLWLSGFGIREEGLLTLNDSGELVKPTVPLPPERMIMVCSGKNQQTLGVMRKDEIVNGWQFMLSAMDAPYCPSAIAVGILAKEGIMRRGAEAHLLDKLRA